MNQDLIQKLQYSYIGQNETHSLPLPLKDSLLLISDFFSHSITNKLCLVFPSKEYSAQWILVPLIFDLIENDYEQYKNEIFESFRHYKLGDKLILNGDAIVEWAGIQNNAIAFKAGREPNVAIFTIDITQSIKLQRAGQARQLSSLARVKNALPGKITTPTDRLLGISSYGSKEFMKNKICLVSKFKTFCDSIEDFAVSNSLISEYFQAGKIDENGAPDTHSPVLISNNLSTLALYATISSNTISKIIIDGFAAIQERGTDFSDIDAKNIPTILITDLSEIESFEGIGNYGFEFFNFTKKNLQLGRSCNLSPFHSFDKKLRNYISFNVLKEICHNEILELTIQKIHSIERDDSNNDLTILIVSLIQLINIVSRIAYIPTAEQISALISRMNSIENMFLRCRMWLGDSHKTIEESITLLKSVISDLVTQPSEKSVRLKTLLNLKHYDYIICSSEEEAKALDNSLSEIIHKPQILSIADVNDKLLASQTKRAILTGWTKSHNINRILSSFLFSELTFLFYLFENKYYNSLQRRNHQNCEKIKTTLNSKGIRYENDMSQRNSFVDLYSNIDVVESTSEKPFDVLEFELKLDNAQYSKYTAKGSLVECIKTKRIDFENDFFIYSSETHKFLIINELIEGKGGRANLHRKKPDALRPGDIIALINTDRDILAELVDNNTNKKDLTAVKQWTNLWKNLLKEYFIANGNNFKKLVDELRKNDCKKHEMTIRAWLQDENRIGPNDDSDLISIAILTNSKELLENIPKVRDSISKMIGWRMQASDFISNQIKSQIHKIVNESLVNSKVEIEGLGSVTILKVINLSNVWEDIDIKYVNKLLKKETI